MIQIAGIYVSPFPTFESYHIVAVRMNDRIIFNKWAYQNILYIWMPVFFDIFSTAGFIRYHVPLRDRSSFNFNLFEIK